MDSPKQIRSRIRENLVSGSTAGLAPGFIQCNVVIISADDADEFAEYCDINPKVCPIISRSEPGQYLLSELGNDVDVRTDLGGYNIFRQGEAVVEVESIREVWRDDFVVFSYGCSFSFEAALLSEGTDLAYLRRGQREALYMTNIETERTGCFGGKLIVSMRPFHPAEAIKAISVTDKFPGVHGAPVHIGLPELIGVDLTDPYETLGPVSVQSDEIPVFWACGVTPQLALIDASLPIWITHKSAHMLITDIRLSEFAEKS